MYNALFAQAGKDHWLAKKVYAYMSITQTLERMVLNQDFLKILNTGAIDRQDLVQCTTSATARCDVSWKVPNKTSSLTSLVP